MINKRNQERALLVEKLKNKGKGMIEVEKKDGLLNEIHPDMLRAMAGVCATDLTSKNPRLSPKDDFETFWKKMKYGTKWNQFDDLRTRSGVWVNTDVVIAKTLHNLYQATLL